MDFGYRKTVERAGYGDGVGPHVLKHQPVPDFEFWEKGFVDNQIDAVTSRAPETARVEFSIGAFLKKNIIYVTTL